MVGIISETRRSFADRQRLLQDVLPKMDSDPNPYLDVTNKKLGFGNNNIDLYNAWLVESLPEAIYSQHQLVVGTNNKIFYENLFIESPHYIPKEGGARLPLTPRNARDKLLSYECDLLVDLVMRDENGVELQRERRYRIGAIPCMVKSSRCTLMNAKNNRELLLYGEDPKEPGGYFIVYGTEKVILLQEQLIYDKIIVQEGDKDNVISRLTSTIPMATRLLELSFSKDAKSSKIFKVRLQSFTERNEKKTRHHPFNVFALFRLLGVPDSRTIINMLSLFLSPKNKKLAKKLTANQWDLNTVNNDIDLVVRKYQAAQHKKILENRSDMSKSEFTNEEKKKIVEQIIETDVFPHLNNPIAIDGETESERYDRIRMSKVKLLFLMLARLVENVYGNVPVDDRDSWNNKRLEGPGRLMDSLCRGAWRKQQFSKQNSNRAIGTFSAKTSTSVGSIADLIQKLKTNDTITASFRESFNTSRWGVKATGKYKENYTQTLNRESMFQTWAHLYTTDAGIPRSNRQFEVRMPHQSAQFFIDAIYTSEGGPCGILKNLAMGTILSKNISDDNIIRDIYSHPELVSRSIKDINEYPNLVLVNSKPIGFSKGDLLYNYLVERKRSGKMEEMVSIFRRSDGIVNVESGPSRLLRPVMIVNDSQEIVLFKKYKKSDPIVFNQLLVNGCVEFISPAEQDQMHIKIAEFPQDIENRIKAIEDARAKVVSAKAKYDADPSEENLLNLRSFEDNFNKANSIGKYTHCEIDPTMCMGFVSATIPRPDTNQGPRDVYAGQMTKQSSSIPHANHRSMHNLSTYKTTQAAVQPLFQTKAYRTIGMDQKGSGENPYTALLITTQTEEDAWKCSNQYFQLGGYRNTKWSVYTTSIDATVNLNDVLRRPDDLDPKMMEKYKYIQGSGPAKGLIYIGAPIKAKDVLVSKVKSTNGRQSKDPLKLKLYEQGVVDSIIWTRSKKSYEISIKVRWTRVPQKGDKYAPRNAQKATIGTKVDVWNLPKDSEGVTPNFIASAMSLPTRMTMEYMYEFPACNVAALTATIEDATAFNKNNNHFRYRKILRDRNYNEMCEVKMWSGLSGRALESTVFVGPIHIMALKHHVEDKYQARGIEGKRSETTNQPVPGRGQEGGLRFGEMEHDCMISHGASDAATQFLMKSSDPFQCVFCKCGEMAVYDPAGDMYRQCKMCKRFEKEFGVCEIPYSYKFLHDILIPMNLYLRPGFATQEEFTTRLLNGTLYKNEDLINKDEEEMEDFEGNEDMIDDIMDAAVGDDYEPGIAGGFDY